MADPLTSTIRLTQPTVSGDSGLWGGLLNSDLAYVDEAINQSITVSIADTNVTLTADGSSSDQARYLRYNFTGALTADRTVTLPANVKVGWATNNTTGGHNVILSAGGTTLSLTDASWTFFQCDGTNITTPTTRIIVPPAAAASTNPLRADQAWQKISSATLSGANNQTFTLSGFTRYRLTLHGLTLNTSNAFMQLRISTDGGNTYLNGASFYAQVGYYLVNSTMTTFSTASSVMLLSVGSATSSAIDGTFEILPGSASIQAVCRGAVSQFLQGATWTIANISNICAPSAATNAIEIFPSNGTYSGTLILEGLP